MRRAFIAGAYTRPYTENRKPRCPELGTIVAFLQVGARVRARPARHRADLSPRPPSL